MLVNTIIRESASGASLKAEILKENNSYSVNYYTNGAIVKTKQYSNQSIEEITELVQNWMSDIKNLNG